MIDVKNITNENLISLIQTLDNIAKPLDRRFQGDDEILYNFMKDNGFHQTVVDKLLIGTLLMRECLVRGIQIPEGN